MAKSSIGDVLREGRLKQRLSIDECAKRTHIAPRYLEAMEEERWDILPSESHRLGFLRLYSRFLGVSSEDILILYRQVKEARMSPLDVPTPKHSSVPKMSLSLSAILSWQRLVLGGILLLVLAWGLYHALGRRHPELPSTVGVRFHPHHARLVMQKHVPVNQRLRIRAQSDSWLRIMNDRRLLFEGILPAGASKEWGGEGSFHLKIGNIQAVAVDWNGQPVPLQAGSQGNAADLRLPPPPPPGRP